MTETEGRILRLQYNTGDNFENDQIWSVDELSNQHPIVITYFNGEIYFSGREKKESTLSQ